MSDDVLAANLCLRDAWPATEIQDVGGWQLRAIGGGFNRTNSVWPGTFSGEMTVDEAIDLAEAFYRKRNLKPRFQALREAVPADLDAILAGRGYARESEYVVLAKPVEARLMPGDVHFGQLPTPDWLDLFVDNVSPERASEFRYILVRVPASRAFFLRRTGDKATALGFAVRRGSDVAVDCIVAHAGHRRAGGGAAITLAAEAWAAGQGARRLVLAVSEGNAAARALFARLGYTPLSDYHYRTLLRG